MLSLSCTCKNHPLLLNCLKPETFSHVQFSICSYILFWTQSYEFLMMMRAQSIPDATGAKLPSTKVQNWLFMIWAADCAVYSRFHENSKLCFYEIQNTWNMKCRIGLWRTEGGCCWLRSLLAISCFYETLKSAKSGPSKAFYKDEMAEQSGWSSLKVVKSFFTEIQLSAGVLCNLRKLILKMKMNLISIKHAIDAGPARWLYTHERERDNTKLFVLSNTSHHNVWGHSE